MSVPSCHLCLGVGEVLVTSAPTGYTYAVCDCQKDAQSPDSLCWKCKTPYCADCTGALCPCAESDTNWNCICNGRDK